MGRDVFYNHQCYPGYMSKCDECDREATFNVEVTSMDGEKYGHSITMRLCLIHFRG